MKRSEFKFLLNKLSELPLSSMNVDRRDNNERTIYSIEGQFTWGYMKIMFQREISGLPNGRFFISLKQRNKREIADYYVCTSRWYSISQGYFNKLTTKIDKEFKELQKKQQEAKMNELTAVMMEVFPEILEKQIFGDDK